MMKCLAAIVVTIFALAAARGLGQEAPKGEVKTPFEEVVKQMIATMDSLTATLATIRDDESAKAAQADLRKAADKWQLVKKNADKLPPPEKQEKDRLAKEYKTKLEQAQKKLFGEVARVSAVPGGRAALLEIRAVLDKKATK
jgi:hypothetical protein